MRDGDGEEAALVHERTQDLRAYVWLPGTPHKASRQDRRLPTSLHQQAVPLAVVRAALPLPCRKAPSPRAAKGRSAIISGVRKLHFLTAGNSLLRSSRSGESRRTTLSCVSSSRSGCRCCSRRSPRCIEVGGRLS